jgi:hypothetical protein
VDESIKEWIMKPFGMYQNSEKEIPQSAIKEKGQKRMPVWGLIATDILLTGCCLCFFALYHHVIPRSIHSDALVIASTTEENYDFSITKDRKREAPEDSVPLFNYNQLTKNYGNTNTMVIASDLSEGSSISSLTKIITEVNSYHSDTIEFTTNRIELGTGGDKITYYISDIYITKLQYLKTAFAAGAYGKNLRDSTLAMAEDNGALLAISGDFYGNGENGIVIRNGVLYRDVGNDADVCVLFTDGSMKTYSSEEFHLEEVIKHGVWQAWTFGPGLLDGEGNILSSFHTTPFLNNAHPRCAIGYVEPGHYIFIVVDGREPGYSRGVTLSELAELMKDAGCKTAYNLDGGKSAAMVCNGEYVNSPCEGGREISDIIYIGE